MSLSPELTSELLLKLEGLMAEHYGASRDAGTWDLAKVHEETIEELAQIRDWVRAKTQQPA